MEKIKSVPGIWGANLQKQTIAVMIVTLVFMVIALVVTYHDGSRFYNPFI